MRSDVYKGRKTFEGAAGMREGRMEEVSRALGRADVQASARQRPVSAAAAGADLRTAAPAARSIYASLGFNQRQHRRA